MKHVHLFIILICLLSLSCKGQKKETNNQQVDSFISIIPKEPIGYVSDFENVFSNTEIRFLDSIIIQHEKNTTNQIAVVTWNLDTLLIKSAEDFNKISQALFRKWGVGQKEKNNGIGLLICPNLRRIRIEVGYGLEKKLTDEEAKKIIYSVIIPYFKKGEYFLGVSKGLADVFSHIQ